ncbi:flagellar export chaperone FliS [Candidatus Epulonipiscium viviparus]|uniref:flagellar export chaperone FliS n=1 Tax=Candidatus Epulonipiscium viviparus TaxID=420336 RepID=UPI0027380430|nr:flagellar export chaperone FliS [Candidatus Epulopiscium viviparus]
MVKQAYNSYRNNAIMTASPAELTLMLYNGAIKFCTMTIESIEKKELSNAHKYNVRVQDIIIELKITLDKKYEIAEEMDRLYTYILKILREGNIEKNVDKINEAKGLITVFRDTWREVMNKGPVVANE